MGIFDDSVSFHLNHHKKLFNTFNFLRGAEKEEPLLGMTNTQLGTLMKDCSREANLENFQLVPYSGRHAGPSGDRARNLRSLEEIRKRGRWGSGRTVQRYEQRARLAEQLNRLDLQTRNRAIECERRIEAVLEGRWTPWPR